VQTAEGPLPLKMVDASAAWRAVNLTPAIRRELDSPQGGLPGEAGSSTGGVACLWGVLRLRPWGQTKDQKRAAIFLKLFLKIFLAQGRSWCDSTIAIAPTRR
jgi:hypothetical protein